MNQDLALRLVKSAIPEFKIGEPFTAEKLRSAIKTSEGKPRRYTPTAQSVCKALEELPEVEVIHRVGRSGIGRNVYARRG